MDYAAKLLSLRSEFHPTKNTHSLDTYKPRSNKRVWWLCAKGHEWETAINSRTALGSGCPKCARQRLGKLFSTPKSGDSLADKYPDLVQEWDYDRNQVSPNSIYPTNKKHYWWRCATCGRSWKATAVSRTRQHTGCASCVAQRKRVRVGVNDVATTHPQLIAEWHPENRLKPSEVCTQSNLRMKWLCAKGHEWETAVSHRTGKRPTSCPVCCDITKLVIAGENDLASLRPDIAKQLSPKEKKQSDCLSVSSGYVALWICDKGHEWRASVCDRTRTDGKATDCRLCAMNGTSKAEQDLFQYVQSLVPDSKPHDRTIADGFEYDISVPSKHIAIEYNGLYWHSEKFKPKNYHRDKSVAARENGWQVIHVWEDDWLTKRDIVERMLAYKLGVSDLPKYNARSLVPFYTPDISPAQARMFLDANHIQGAVGGSVRLGLKTREGELVALMLFKRRDKDGNFELVRYATNGIVRGGFSKLLSMFKKFEPEWRTVVSFSDVGVSDGDMYSSNGFILSGGVMPDYSYFYDGFREHKFGFRKARFRDRDDLEYKPNLTEAELAQLNDIPRIYDCGKMRWLLLR